MTIETTIEVEQFSIAKAKSPEILYSGVLSTCIAIGFYDFKSRSGYMLHESELFPAETEERFKMIQGEFGSKIKIMATGASLDDGDMALCKNCGIKPEEINSNLIDNKRYAATALRKYFRKSCIRLAWSPRNRIAELSLDTSNGKFLLEFSDSSSGNIGHPTGSLTF